MEPDLYPHQRNAVERLRNGSILCGGVGTGKSRTAIAYYCKNESPKDLYVITTARKRDSLDWDGEAIKFGIGTRKDATLRGTLTVDSWNNIKKYEDVKGSFFIFDEQRVVGYGAWSKAFIKIARKNHWILLSATPGDTWLDYAPVFIANGFYKNITDFKNQHVAYSYYGGYPQVQRYLATGKLLKLRKDILVNMPYAKGTIRHISKIDLGFDKVELDMIRKRRWNLWEDRPIKDAAEMVSLMRRLVNSDPSRLDYIRNLLKSKKKIIVFYNFDYELDILRTLASDEVVVREWNGHKHEEVPSEYDSWVYLVQYMAGSEAWNCVETDTMVFYSMTYSYKMFEQSQGRIDRMNTTFTHLYYHVLSSKTAIDRTIWGCLDAKKDFNESAFRKSCLPPNGGVGF